MTRVVLPQAVTVTVDMIGGGVMTVNPQVLVVFVTVTGSGVTVVEVLTTEVLVNWDVTAGGHHENVVIEVVVSISGTVTTAGVTVVEGV
jgi:hypothetical protein